MHKIWSIRSGSKEKASEISEKFHLDPIAAYILSSRNINDEDIDSFLSDSYDLISPFDFIDMDTASFVIGDAIDNGEKICIYGDYDCDGLTSTALLYKYLKSEGADVFYYIPNRLSEGYGINIDAIDEICDKGTSLIITVDTGISAIEEAKYIYEKGMRLVVTDHHQIGDELPIAEAVVDPFREENNLKFREMCGVSVAFKLICALNDGEYEDIIDDYIEFVTVGTIGDMMPLVKENRVLVKLGLKKINTNPSIPLRSFLDYINGNNILASDIAYKFCPRLNALGRMGNSLIGIKYLTSNNLDEANKYINELASVNSDRQEAVKAIVDNIDKTIEEKPHLIDDDIIVLSGKDFHQGVIGIAAANIENRYSKPTIILSIDEDGIAKGSARSVEGFNIFEAIGHCSDLLVKFGGHPLAAGLTLESKNIDDFRKQINNYAKNNFDTIPIEKLNIDCRISPKYLDINMVNNLSIFEPCGEGNESAVIGLMKLTITDITSVSNGRFSKFSFKKDDTYFNAISFEVSYNECVFQRGDVVDIAVKISKNIYNGKTYLSIQIVDIRPTDCNDDKYLKEIQELKEYKLRQIFDFSNYPNRDDFALVYKFLKSRINSLSIDDLYVFLNNQISYLKLYIIIHTFEEVGFIDKSNSIKLLNVKNKVSLEDSNTLTRIREQYNFGK